MEELKKKKEDVEKEIVAYTWLIDNGYDTSNVIYYYVSDGENQLKIIMN